MSPHSTPRERTKVLWECAQDGLDLLIPGSALEYIPAGPGMVALAGTITSLIGWQAAWPKA